MNMGRFSTVMAIAVLLGLGVAPASACTGLRIVPKDGAVLFGRTLEFGQDLHSNVVVLPRGHEGTGVTPDGKPGLAWKSQYGIVGVNGFGLPFILDGINEKGLGIGLFYFPGYAKFPEIKADEANKTIASWQVSVYLLGKCATVPEAVAAIKEVRVGAAELKEMGGPAPVHFILNDAGGHCAVLEYVSGELKVHDNPLGVLTNAPTFDWHLTNLCNYINLSVTNVPPLEVGGMKLAGLGQGTGMLGLPGDFTPPSRFVQATIFAHSAVPVDTAQEGVLQLFHLLNQFDIPKGIARGADNGKQEIDYTHWTGGADLKNLRYYFRTYANSQIRMVDMKKVDLDAKAMKTISMAGEEVIKDVSSEAK